MVLGRLFSLLLVLFSLAALYFSLRIEGQSAADPSSASFFPALISVIMLICAVLIVIRTFRYSYAKAAVVHAEPEAVSDEEETVFEKENVTRKQLVQRISLFIVAVVLFAILMNVVNFMLLSFLFLFGSMIMLNRQKPLVSFIVSAIFSVLFYYIFYHVFHIVFPA